MDSRLRGKDVYAASYIRVIPAKAGIHAFCGPGRWIPVFTGMTHAQ